MRNLFVFVAILIFAASCARETATQKPLSQKTARNDLLNLSATPGVMIYSSGFLATQFTKANPLKTGWALLDVRGESPSILFPKTLTADSKWPTNNVLKVGQVYDANEYGLPNINAWNGTLAARLEYNQVVLFSISPSNSKIEVLAICPIANQYSSKEELSNPCLLQKGSSTIALGSSTAFVGGSKVPYQALDISDPKKPKRTFPNFTAEQLMEEPTSTLRFEFEMQGDLMVGGGKKVISNDPRINKTQNCHESRVENYYFKPQLFFDSLNPSQSTLAIFKRIAFGPGLYLDQMCWGNRLIPDFKSINGQGNFIILTDTTGVNHLRDKGTIDLWRGKSPREGHFESIFKADSLHLESARAWDFFSRASDQSAAFVTGAEGVFKLQLKDNKLQVKQLARVIAK